MSERMSVRSYRREYSVEWVGDVAAALGAALRPGDCVVIDSGVWDLYRESLESYVGQHRHKIIETSESAKSLASISDLLTWLVDGGFRKNHRLFAIGGGVVQDIVGFSASVLFRGVEWIFIPTNLLTQADSCIGSKTSINLGAYKNQLGSFFPPSRILLDPGFLETLSEREIRSGIGEMAHYFLLEGEPVFSEFERDIDTLLSDRQALAPYIRRSLAIKHKMIEHDEFDTGPRNIFNYGHTFGHAIESATNYRIPHGIAVAYGMDLANLLSVQLGHIEDTVRERIRGSLCKIWAGHPLGPIEISDFVSALAMDKKNEGTEIKAILSSGIGRMFKTTIELTPEIRSTIERFLSVCEVHA